MSRQEWGTVVSTSTGYWTCGMCGTLVSVGMTHSCGRTPSKRVSDACRQMADDALAEYLADKKRPTGWTCPRCTRVYAPHVGECAACNASVPPAGSVRGAAGGCGASDENKEAM